MAMMGREELLQRAMHTLSDFPELLTGAGNRVLADAYRRAESPLKQLARQRTAADFRPLSTLKIGNFTKLEKVTEAGEIKSLSTAEAKEGYSIETFSGIFSLSRKAIINDDLGAFTRWGEMMGQAAAETEAGQLLALLSANAGAGVTMENGKALFHVDHGNLAASGAALSEATLDAARQAMRIQKMMDGKTPVNVVPRFLVVSPARETAAEKLLTSIQANTTADVNPFGGKLSLIVEPRLTGNGWFIFGAVRMGRQHMRNGVLSIVQQKTGQDVHVPLHPELKAAIDSLPFDNLTFLVTAQGKPFSPAGCTNWFREVAREAGLPDGLSPHGLRKATCRRLAEAGCTPHEIMAISGHRSLAEVTRYTVEADRKGLAQRAVDRLDRIEPRTETVKPIKSV